MLISLCGQRRYCTAKVQVNISAAEQPGDVDSFSLTPSSNSQEFVKNSMK